mmetsp:Transcript_772/g.1848  ORF Transcript_772/g.1848 Transcript_772/m.1848 type:complete len:383 (+) Transcript_772:193-1341(+)
MMMVVLLLRIIGMRWLRIAFRRRHGQTRGILTVLRWRRRIISLLLSLLCLILISRPFRHNGRDKFTHGTSSQPQGLRNFGQGLVLGNFKPFVDGRTRALRRHGFAGRFFLVEKASPILRNGLKNRRRYRGFFRFARRGVIGWTIVFHQIAKADIANEFAHFLRPSQGNVPFAPLRHFLVDIWRRSSGGTVAVAAASRNGLRCCCGSDGNRLGHAHRGGWGRCDSRSGSRESAKALFSQAHGVGGSLDEGQGFFFGSGLLQDNGHDSFIIRFIQQIHQIFFFGSIQGKDGQIVTATTVVASGGQEIVVAALTAVMTATPQWVPTGKGQASGAVVAGTGNFFVFKAQIKFNIVNGSNGTGQQEVLGCGIHEASCCCCCCHLGYC